MPPKTTLWALEPHTRAKHLILRRYLGAWLPMLARYNGRIVYIDGFAGPGRYKKGEEGSPIIALKALLDHPHFKTPKAKREVVFFFIEEDARRARFLREEIARLRKSRPFPDWMKVPEVTKGEFAPVMSEILDGLDRDGGRLAPTFAFIDPFGFSGAPLSVISRIAANPRCEVLITFMLGPVSRWLKHPDPKIAGHMDELFGTPRWREIGQLRDARRRAGILSLYQKQLTAAAGLAHVRTFQMVNKGNRTQYFLVFGTNSKGGLSRMKEAMWKADPVKGQGFSDRTATGQMVLLEPGADLEPLKEALQLRFRGSEWVPISDIEDFILVSTPYCERSHLKRKTLAPMEKQTLIECLRPRDQDRRGTYPDGTLIRFLT